jgi:hypothetical protein
MRVLTEIRRGALLLAAACLPAAAGAATISSVSIAINAGNTADLLDDSGNETSAAQSTASILASSSTSFDARYAAVASADRTGGGGGTVTQSFTGDFTITFQITETAATAWSLTLDVLRIGAQTIVSDGPGEASVSVGALTGTLGGAGTLDSGSLGLAALTTLSNSSSPGSDLDSAFSQSTSAVISGIGTGAAQTVTLGFVFSASANAVDPPGAPPQADEAALRMGLDSALSNFSADDYPGLGLRNLVTDGIFVALELIEAPEPGTALLLGSGLLGLGMRRSAQWRGGRSVKPPAGAASPAP